ncbi:MAG: FeoA family protein [Cyanobacteria bacterium P01_C01_bin.72]
MNLTTYIPELSPGSAATIIGYSRVYGGYIGKLISLGLLPGTSLVILTIDPNLGNVQIMLQERIITLSKPEVNALIVETTEDEPNC